MITNRLLENLDLHLGRTLFVNEGRRTQSVPQKSMIKQDFIFKFYLFMQQDILFTDYFLPKRVFDGITSADDDASDHALPPPVDVAVACASAVAEFNFVGTY